MYDQAVQQTTELLSLEGVIYIPVSFPGQCFLPFSPIIVTMSSLGTLIENIPLPGKGKYTCFH